MKKMFLLAVAAIFLGIFPLPAAAAWVFVDFAESSGWQSYTYTASSSGFSGAAGFFIRVDSVAPSLLILDNLSQCAQPGNQGFEWGDFSGYTLEGSGVVQKPSITGPFGLNGRYYDYPATEGEYLADLHGGVFSPPAIFPNAFGNPGTPFSLYSYLETAISLAAGQSFTFDWAFIASNAITSQDFCKFYLKDESGNVVFQDGLGQLNNPVPVPATLPLLGSGLLGLWGWRRRVKGK